MTSNLVVDIYIILGLIALSVGVFFVTSILTSSSIKSFPNKLLALLLLIASYELCYGIVIRSGFIFKIPSWFGWGGVFLLAYGPLLYIYSLSLIKKEFTLRSVYLLHFIPFLIWQIIHIKSYFKPSSIKIEKLIRHWDVKAGVVRQIDVGIIDLSIIIYIILTFILLSKFKKSSIGFINKYKINRIWVKRLLYFYLLIWLLLKGSILLSNFEIINISHSAVEIILYSLFTLIISFLWINQMGTDIPYHGWTQKYSSSYLSKNDTNIRLNKILQLVEKEKRYKDPKISLNQLADELNISSKHLSQIINEQMNMNFSEFINSYRIKETTKRLSDLNNDIFTIESIALDAGFNSIDSFYRSFKRHTGLTPTDFRKTRKN
ncbi:helix-turn-helix domain-containing protein [Pontimicrobium aquaticum]|nr:helix-turn-helix domain-containing protein [Pontimicrobium aquaticum]